jgi:hypothetical protein
MLKRLDPEQAELVKQNKLEAKYNVETIPAQDRIAAWLNGPDSKERNDLRDWLKEQGFAGSEKGAEAFWLLSAPADQLEAAIARFGIP